MTHKGTVVCCCIALLLSFLVVLVVALQIQTTEPKRDKRRSSKKKKKLTTHQRKFAHWIGIQLHQHTGKSSGGEPTHAWKLKISDFFGIPLPITIRGRVGASSEVHGEKLKKPIKKTNKTILCTCSLQPWYMVYDVRFTINFEEHQGRSAPLHMDLTMGVMYNNVFWCDPC